MRFSDPQLHYEPKPKNQTCLTGVIKCGIDIRSDGGADSCSRGIALSTIRVPGWQCDALHISRSSPPPKKINPSAAFRFALSKCPLPLPHNHTIRLAPALCSGADALGPTTPRLSSPSRNLFPAAPHVTIVSTLLS